MPQAVGPRARLGDRSVHVAGLVRRRRRTRLHRPAVPHCELRRPNQVPPPGTLADADLSAVARDLLHVVDILRIGGLRIPQRVGVSGDLRRPDADDGAVLSAGVAHRAPGQSPEHHFDRGFHRGPLRQASGRGGDRGADRHHRHGSLYRVAAQGRFQLARHHPGSHRIQYRPLSTGNGGSRVLRRAGDGGVRGAVRDPADRRHRASGRIDPGDRNRVDRQTGRLHRGRPVRDVRSVRRTNRAVRTGSPTSPIRPPSSP